MIIIFFLVLILILIFLYLKCENEKFVSYSVDTLDSVTKHECYLIIDTILDDINTKYKKKLVRGEIDRVEKTFMNKKLQVNLALNYGSKIELINAFKSLLKSKKKINENNLNRFLQTKNIPDPDLLIRTGNTKRLSNFLLWQIAYSEIFFEKKLWPAFNEKDYIKIIKKYKIIKRNFGKI